MISSGFLCQGLEDRRTKKRGRAWITSKVGDFSIRQVTNRRLQLKGTRFDNHQLEYKGAGEQQEEKKKKGGGIKGANDKLAERSILREGKGTDYFC